MSGVSLDPHVGPRRSSARALPHAARVCRPARGVAGRLDRAAGDAPRCAGRRRSGQGRCPREAGHAGGRGHLRPHRRGLVRHAAGAPVLRPAGVGPGRAAAATAAGVRRGPRRSERAGDPRGRLGRAGRLPQGAALRVPRQPGQDGAVLPAGGRAVGPHAGPRHHHAPLLQRLRPGPLPPGRRLPCARGPVLGRAGGGRPGEAHGHGRHRRTLHRAPAHPRAVPRRRCARRERAGRGARGDQLRRRPLGGGHHVGAHRATRTDRSRRLGRAPRHRPHHHDRPHRAAWPGLHAQARRRRGGRGLTVRPALLPGGAGGQPPAVAQRRGGGHDRRRRRLRAGTR